ncbi:MAG: polyphosphate kinase 2 family protein [Rikenellaceae bacterium]|nr:polyphosphate kinase 2 family protein [Rikenellaceae bacterium]
MTKDEINKFLAVPGLEHNVNTFESDYNGIITKAEGTELLRENIMKLAELQDKLYAHDRYAVLVVFQAMDAAGKDGTIKHVFSGINPQGCHVNAFKQPSDEELDHDYLWRIYTRLPERGRIGIFNRSHYEDVLVVKVNPEILLHNKLPGIYRESDITENFWNERYRQINDFERHLTETGTIVIKFFLNVSEKEQEKRFIARLKDPSKNWKFSASDMKERDKWNDYMNAYSDILTETSTSDAPWFVIPADKKWYMRYAVSQILVDRISALPIGYPQLTEKQEKEIESAKEKLLYLIDK